MNFLLNNFLFAVFGVFLPVVIFCGQFSCLADAKRYDYTCVYMDNSLFLYGFVMCAVSLYCNPQIYKFRNVSINNCLIWMLLILTCLSGFKVASLKQFYYQQYLSFATSIANFAYVVITWGSHLDKKMNSPLS